MIKVRLIFLCLWLGIMNVSAQVNALDSLRQQFEAETATSIRDFEAYRDSSYEAYARYEQQAREEFAKYVSSIQEVWGDTLTDSKTEWVAYSADRKERSIVDFETGQIQVEVALDKDENEGEVRRKLEEAVVRLLENRGSTLPFNDKEAASHPLTHQPILDNLLDLSPYENADDDVVAVAPKRVAPPKPVVKGKDLPNVTTQSVVTPKKQAVKDKSTTSGTLADRRNKAKERASEKVARWKQSSASIAERIVQQSKPQWTKVKGSDGKERQVVTLQMNLVTDNLSKNAALYKDLVTEFSNRFQVEQPLIFAIMEQESAFNPQAKSWVPAYGLMQLVPKSGGRDAYRYVYKKDYIPESSYLYNPRNNIELGTAYLRVLLNQFDRVADDGCRRLCVIAAYNTGAGNVSRSFTGSTNLSNAFSYINQYDYSRLYNHMLSKLPYEETRNYVKKVVQRREKYLK